jgi:hypothetical protein
MTPGGGAVNRVSDDYADRRIECTPDGIRIHGYYFPWGTKHVPYDQVRSLQRFELSARRGRGRIWGTANPRHWANFDPGRPKKSVGFFLDLGRRVQPFVTPDDPDRFEGVVRRRCRLDTD